jgi:MFS superfamily sulfate permease-like transporter
MLLGVLPGILLAVVVSVALFFWRSWVPYSAELVELEGRVGFHDAGRHPEGERVPGLVVLRWSAPLFFANATLFRKRIRDVVAASDPPPRWIIVAAAPVNDIDTTAGDTLEQLDRELNQRGTHLAFAELQGRVRDRIIKYGLLETIDRGRIFDTVEEAVAAYRRESGSESSQAADKGQGPS